MEHALIPIYHTTLSIPSRLAVGLIPCYLCLSHFALYFWSKLRSKLLQVSSAYHVIDSTEGGYLELSCFADCDLCLSQNHSWSCKYEYFRTQISTTYTCSQPWPPLIYTLFALYAPSFIYSHVTQTPYTVIEDDVNITVLETEQEDQPLGSAAHSQNISGSDKPKHVEEEVEVNETVVIEQKSRRPFYTLLTGAPDPVSTLLSLLTFLINVALVLATIDLVYHAKVLHPSTELSFARMGYMYVQYPGSYTRLRLVMANH